MKANQVSHSVLFVLALSAFAGAAEDATTLVAKIHDPESVKQLQVLGKAAVPALVQGVEASEHKDVILNVLGSIGDPSSLPAILKFTGDSVIEHRMAAGYALRNFKTPEATAAASKLLSDSASRVRMAALQALLVQQAAPEAPAIVKLLEDGEWPLRKESARVLGELKAKAALADLSRRLHFVMVEDPDAAKDKENKPEKPVLIPKYDESIAAVRMECIRSLGKTGDPAGIDAFLPLFANGSDVERKAAVEAVQQIGKPGADKAFVSLRPLPEKAVREDPETIQNAYLTVALTRLNDERAIEPATKLIALADTFATIEMVEFLGNRKVAAAAPALAELFASNSVEQVQTALFNALPKIGKPASDQLLKLLPDRKLCVEVMKLLERPELQSREAVPQFLKHLEDEEYDIRLGAVRVLVAHKAKEAVKPLESALVSDPDERVRDAAADALKALTGKDYRK